MHQEELQLSLFDNKKEDNDNNRSKENVDEQLIEHLDEISNSAISDFPIQVFPNRIRKMILATNEALNFPIGYTSSAVLYATSLAIGKNYKVIPQAGWEEAASLWIALIGKAGAAKSPVLKYVLKPFVDLERKANVDYAEKAIRYNALNKKEKADAEEPWPVRYFVQDVTQEALMVTHQKNIRGVGLKFDELVSWWENLDRYSGNTEGLFLSGWDGDSNKIDRISRPSIEIDEMYLPIIGGTQPSKLFSLAKNGRESSGFMARILFCFPDDAKKGKWNDKQLSPEHLNYWEYIIKKLIDSDIRGKQKLRFTPKAYQIIKHWQHKNADAVNELGEGMLSEMYNKAERQCVRLSLILQMLYWASGEENKEVVDIRAVKGAIKLADYFKHQAKKVTDYLYESSPLDRMKNHYRDFYKALPDEFSREEAKVLGEKMKITGGTLNRFLANKEVFGKSGRSHYIKLV